MPFLPQWLKLGAALCRADMTSQRRRSAFGRAWLFIPAVAAAVGAVYIRDRGIVTVRGVDMPYPVFIVAGVMLWQLFVESFAAPVKALEAHRPLLTRVLVPHAAVIASGILAVGIAACLRLGALVLLCLLLNGSVAPTALLMPLGMFALATLGCAGGLLLAPVAMLWDDVRRGATVAVNAAVIVTPVAYPIASSGWQRWNPMLPLIDQPRAWLVGQSGQGSIALAALFSAALLIVAIGFYRVARPHVVARLG